MSTTAAVNDIGDIIETSNYRTVLAERKAVRQSEFYQAAAAGLRPELTFIVWSREYQDERLLEYQSQEYSIIRTFDRGDERTELVCQGPVNRA